MHDSRNKTRKNRAPPAMVPNRNAQDGFTIIETLIATTLFVLVMLIAVQVLLEANTLLIRSGKEEMNILPGAALALIRSDINNATELGGISETPWVSVPLVLQHAEGAAVYSIEEGACLNRRQINEETVVIGERCILKNVVGLRWRFADNRVLKVQVDTEVWKEPSGAARLDDLRMRRGRRSVESHSLTALARASKTGSSW